MPILRGRALAVLPLIFFLSSCVEPSSCDWQREEYHSHFPGYSSKIISLPPANDDFGLELELASYSTESDRMYINLFSLPIPENPNRPKKVDVAIAFESSTETVEADLFSGGQRILLPPEAAQKIIDSLLEGQAVTISVDRYRGEIYPENFSFNFSEGAHS